jgi:hypothetical protein
VSERSERAFWKTNIRELSFTKLNQNQSIRLSRSFLSSFIKKCASLRWRSPIFTDFSQTLSGTSSIRAYGVGSRFFAKCVQSFDINNAAFIMTQLTNNWLGIRLDVLGGVIAAFIGGERAKRASLDEDEHTRDESREMATDGYIHY